MRKLIALANNVTMLIIVGCTRENVSDHVERLEGQELNRVSHKRKGTNGLSLLRREQSEYRLLHTHRYEYSFGAKKDFIFGILEPTELIDTAIW